MSHRSELLEGYIEKFVEIEFRPINGIKAKHRGILKRNTKGFRPYKLQTKNYDYIFSKSEVKDIKEVTPWQKEILINLSTEKAKAELQEVKRRERTEVLRNNGDMRYMWKA